MIGDIKQESNVEAIKYLELLANKYPTINSASTEIINLQAILNLPKGTEHYVSDIHGEYESFRHVLKNASGVIKEYINEIFGNTLRDSEKRSLATLIYYPERKLPLVIEEEKDDIDDWYRIMLFRLILICKRVSNKYTRSKVRKAMPAEFSYILEELISEDGMGGSKEQYYNEIIDAIIRLGRADDIIIAMSNVISRLAIDRLHVIGDIYDRGPDADKILDILLKYHSVDVQWGNHDISWMGAASGSDALICNVIRISARYNNLHIIEESYGINLVPLATFAMEHYAEDDCAMFYPETTSSKGLSSKEKNLIAKMHKAICVLQLKVEAEAIARNPEFDMESRVLLTKINFSDKTVAVNEKSYKLKDSHFPTISPENPIALTDEEKSLVKKLRYSFKNSEKLQEHARFLFNKGSMYLVCNGNLLFHGCIPLNKDGSLKYIKLFGEETAGKEYLDKIEVKVREAYFTEEYSLQKQKNLDLMWFLWCGPNSPLYGKDKMATFERYFINEKETHAEHKDPYYQLRNMEEVCKGVLEGFGLDPETAHIINGHVPVEVKRGENPVKANGRLIVIDGGFQKAYQQVTGIAGYTLINRSRGLTLVSHEPFSSSEEAVISEKDILSQSFQLEYSRDRVRVMDTDDGKRIINSIKDLELLLFAYKKGLLKELLIN